MSGEYVIPTILGRGGSVRGSVIGDQFLRLELAVRLGDVDALMAVLSLFVVLYIVFATREEQFGA